MGGVRQAAIRRTGTGSQVSGALCATDSPFQQPAPIAGKRPGHLRVEGLRRQEPEQNDYAGCRGVHPPFSSPRLALRLCSDSALRLFGQSQSDEKAGAVPLLTACPSNRRRAQNKDWRTGATPLPNLQGRLVGLYRNTPGRGNRLCAGAHDRGHLMIDKGTPSTKSRSNSSGPAARREISVRTNGFSAPQTLAPVANHGIGHPPRWEGDLFHRRVASSLATLPTAHPTDCHSIPIDPAPAQFNEFYR